MAKRKPATTKGKGKQKVRKPKIGGNKSYDFTPQADILLSKLKKELKSTRTKIINEAVVHYALANGIEIDGPEMPTTTDGLAKKIKKLEKTVALLGETRLLDSCDQGEIERTKELVQGAVDGGTEPRSYVLWKKLKNRLPTCMKEDKYVFRVFLAVHGIPKKSK